MMSIKLVRHGKPEFEFAGWINARQFSQMVNGYDHAPLSEQSRPLDETLQQMAECNFIVCSDLRRSIESAACLGFDKADLIDKDFREWPMPSTKWKLVKLTTLQWILFFRIAQLLNYSLNCESFYEMKKRAARCADKLIQLAHEHSHIVFIGHGLLNWFIRQQLIKKGWQGPKRSSTKNWSCAIYLCENQGLLSENITST